jgi:hypothetical protein
MAIRSPTGADPQKPDVLTDVVAKVLSIGANEFEVEYKDGHEEICAMRGPIGFGVASLKSSSAQAQELRTRLCDAKKKRQRVIVDGNEYVLRVEIFESFGEDAFRVTITRARSRCSKTPAS